MMQKLAGSIQVHKVTAPAAVSEVAGADPDARDERRADEEQLRGLFTSVNAHRGPGGGGEAAVAAAVAAAAASWNVDEGLLSALVAHARLPVSFVEVKVSVERRGVGRRVVSMAEFWGCIGPERTGVERSLL
jgi:hypothetical protein